MKKLNKRGFTIVELVVVIAVIAILAAVLIPSFSGIVAKAKNAAACENVHNAYTATLFDESEKTTKTFTDAVEKATANGLIVKIGDDSDVIYVKLSKNGAAEVATNATSADWEVKDGLIVKVSTEGGSK